MPINFENFNARISKASQANLSLQIEAKRVDQNPKTQGGVDAFGRAYQELTNATRELVTDLDLGNEGVVKRLGGKEFASSLKEKMVGLHTQVSSLEGFVQNLTPTNPEPLEVAWIRAHDAVTTIQKQREQLVGWYAPEIPDVVGKITKKLSSMEVAHAKETAEITTHLEEAKVKQKGLKEEIESPEFQQKRMLRLLEGAVGHIVEDGGLPEDARKQLRQDYLGDKEKLRQVEQKIEEIGKAVAAQRKAYEENTAHWQEKRQAMQALFAQGRSLDLQAQCKASSLESLEEVYGQAIEALTGEKPKAEEFKDREEDQVRASAQNDLALSPWERVQQDLEAIASIEPAPDRSIALRTLFNAAGISKEERQAFYVDLQNEDAPQSEGKVQPPCLRYGYLHGADHMDLVRDFVEARILEASRASTPALDASAISDGSMVVVNASAALDNSAVLNASVALDESGVLVNASASN